MEPLAPWRIWTQVAVVSVGLFVFARSKSPGRHIVALCMASMIVYGMLQDQFSVRICVEYFTIGHPPIVGLEPYPTLHGIAWGFLASWWGGMILGYCLAIPATMGSKPHLRAAFFIMPLCVYFAFVTLATLAMGFWGHLSQDKGPLFDFTFWDERIPPEQRAGFRTLAYAHLGTYTSATLGGILLTLWTIRVRRRIPESSSLPVAGMGKMDAGQ